MSVDKCTRTAGCCAYRMRCAYATYGTCTLMHTSYGVSTLTDAHSRELTNGDGLKRSQHWETVCVRSPHVLMECLHDATICLHMERVCLHKSATTRARPLVYTSFYKPRAHDFSHWVCTCWSVRLSACFTLACPIFYFNLNLCVLCPDIYIYFIPSLFLVV